MKDLYTILGVKKTASYKQIKQAYYRLATIHHPDKNNGKPSPEFVEINLAYTVLMDKEQRKIYNDTGEYNKDSVDSRGKMLMRLARLLFAVISNEFYDPSTDDLFEEMKAALNTKIDSFEKQKDGFVAMVRKMTIVKNNISGNDTLFSDMIEMSIKDHEANILKIDKEIEIAEEAIKILDEYKYNVEDIPVQIEVRLSGTGSATFGL